MLFGEVGPSDGLFQIMTNKPPLDSILKSLQKLFHAAWPAENWVGRGVVLAVSGGADSVALTRLFCDICSQQKSTGNINIAHFNHRLRGAESDEDYRFVESLAKELGCTFFGIRATNEGSLGDSSVEESARNLRYDFFKNVANKTGSRFVVTAHHADDQVETVIHRIARGTSVAGLAGIPRERLLDAHTTIVRPLLAATRSQLHEYLENIGQEFRKDHTNEMLNATRNRIRLNVLPTLREQVHQAAEKSVLKLAQSASEYQQLLLDVALPCFAESCKFDPNKIVVLTDALSRLRPLVQRQVFMLCWEKMNWKTGDMSYEKWDLLREAVSSEPTELAAFELPGAIRVFRKGNLLTIQSQKG